MTSPGLKSTVEVISSEKGCLLRDTTTGRETELSALEWRIVSMWDGQALPAQLAEMARRAGLAIEQKHIVVLLQRLVRAGFLLAPRPGAALATAAPGPLVSPLPRLRSGLRLSKSTRAGCVEVVDTRNNRTFTLYDFEVSIARMLDGRRGAPQVIEAAAKIGITVTAQTLQRFIQQLRTYDFLEEDGATQGDPTWPDRKKWGPEVRELYQSALRLSRSDRPDEALRQLDVLFTIAPETPEALELKERCLQRRRELASGAKTRRIEFAVLHAEEPSADPFAAFGAEPGQRPPNLPPRATPGEGLPAYPPRTTPAEMRVATPRSTPPRGLPAPPSTPSRGLSAARPQTPAKGVPAARTTPARGLPVVGESAAPPPLPPLPPPPAAAPSASSSAVAQAPARPGGVSVSSLPPLMKSMQNTIPVPSTQRKALSAQRAAPTASGAKGPSLLVHLVVALIGAGLGWAVHPVPHLIDVPCELRPRLLGQPVVPRDGALDQLKVKDGTEVRAQQVVATLGPGPLDARRRDLEAHSAQLQAKLRAVASPPDSARLAALQAEVDRQAKALAALEAKRDAAKGAALTRLVKQVATQAEVVATAANRVLEAATASAASRALEVELAAAYRKLGELNIESSITSVTSPTDGIFLVPPLKPGTEVKKGQQFGRVIAMDFTVVAKGALPANVRGADVVLRAKGKRWPLTDFKAQADGATAVVRGAGATLIGASPELVVRDGTRLWVREVLGR